MKKIYVTKPFLPPLEDLINDFRAIWESGILSNGGPMHTAFEQELSSFFGGLHVSLFCNATVALTVAQKALGITGEVITTPYTFAATTHAIAWINNVPVFADIDADHLGLNPKSVEAAITENTTCIMPVHCYGRTGDPEALQALAEERGLRVIHDACHSFGIEDSGGSVMRYGDASVVSFHATKVFNTFEGGVVVTRDSELKSRIDRLKNFGFVDEITVTDLATNGKMSELNAVVGRHQLRLLPTVLAARARIDQRYREKLSDLKGIKLLDRSDEAVSNFSYFPIFITDAAAASRDQVFEKLAAADVHCRRYFYPLVSSFPMYSHLESAQPANLPIAHTVSSTVICLPIYPDLDLEDVDRIAAIVCDACQ